MTAHSCCDETDDEASQVLLCTCRATSATRRMLPPPSPSEPPTIRGTRMDLARGRWRSEEWTGAKLGRPLLGDYSSPSSSPVGCELGVGLRLPFGGARNATWGPPIERAGSPKTSSRLPPREAAARKGEREAGRPMRRQRAPYSQNSRIHVDGPVAGSVAILQSEPPPTTSCPPSFPRALAAPCSFAAVLFPTGEVARVKGEKRGERKRCLFSEGGGRRRGCTCKEECDLCMVYDIGIVRLLTSLIAREDFSPLSVSFAMSLEEYLSRRPYYANSSMS
ncbi:hypothetical protein KM043_006756 [Ampulex compressa]|nr:hypothetical protein KM043_006756 [Ampulex compressa]